MTDPIVSARQLAERHGFPLSHETDAWGSFIKNNLPQHLDPEVLAYMEHGMPAVDVRLGDILMFSPETVRRRFAGDAAHPFGTRPPAVLLPIAASPNGNILVIDLIDDAVRYLSFSCFCEPDWIEGWNPLAQRIQGFPFTPRNARAACPRIAANISEFLEVCDSEDFCDMVRRLDSSGYLNEWPVLQPENEM